MIESRLVEAFLTLTQPETSRRRRGSPAARTASTSTTWWCAVEIDKAKTKVALDEATKVADAYYAKARRSMREGDFHNAIQYGKLAISYNPSDARFYYMLARLPGAQPGGALAAPGRGELHQARPQLDPWNADYWISLGRFYKRRGLKLRARKQFEEALKLVPERAEVLARSSD